MRKATRRSIVVDPAGVRSKAAARPTPTQAGKPEKRASGRGAQKKAIATESAPREFSPEEVSRHLTRVRRICLGFAGAIEKLSHGEPTFFTSATSSKRAFAMFSENHHDDGHLAVLLPVGFEEQERLIEERPGCFYFPAYVGVSGWVGVELREVGDRELEELIEAAWTRVATKSAVRKRAEGR